MGVSQWNKNNTKHESYMAKRTLRDKIRPTTLVSVKTYNILQWVHGFLYIVWVILHLFYCYNEHIEVTLPQTERYWFSKDNHWPLLTHFSCKHLKLKRKDGETCVNCVLSRLKVWTSVILSRVFWEISFQCDCSHTNTSFLETEHF